VAEETAAAAVVIMVVVVVVVVVVAVVAAAVVVVVFTFLLGPWPEIDNKNKQLMHCCCAAYKCHKSVNKLSITDVQF
jgi:hypothetical protein